MFHLCHFLAQMVRKPSQMQSSGHKYNFCVFLWYTPAFRFSLKSHSSYCRVYTNSQSDFHVVRRWSHYCTKNVFFFISFHFNGVLIEELRFELSEENWQGLPMPPLLLLPHPSARLNAPDNL